MDAKKPVENVANTLPLPMLYFALLAGHIFFLIACISRFNYASAAIFDRQTGSRSLSVNKSKKITQFPECKMMFGEESIVSS